MPLCTPFDPQGINVQCKVDLGTVKRYQLKILSKLHSIVKIDLIDYLILCHYSPLTKLIIPYQIVRPSPDSSSLIGFLVPSWSLIPCQLLIPYQDTRPLPDYSSLTRSFIPYSIAHPSPDRSSLTELLIPYWIAHPLLNYSSITQLLIPHTTDHPLLSLPSLADCSSFIGLLISSWIAHHSPDCSSFAEPLIPYWTIHPQLDQSSLTGPLAHYKMWLNFAENWSIKVPSSKKFKMSR